MLLRTVIVLLLALSTAASYADEERHPLMGSKWWLTAGSFFAQRDFKASAGVNLAGVGLEADFEGSTGVDDSPELFMAEFGWQFGEKWGLAVQHFRSSRSGSRVLEDTIEWQGVTYNAGVQLEAKTEMEITRIFVARRFWDEGPHSLRVGAGIHWLAMGAEVAGQATLNDQSTEFRRSAAAADVPVPNIGAWYRYSPNRTWIINARVDWLSAGIDNFSGRIWNASAGVGLRLTDHIGIGVNYQYFELSGDLTEPNWRGDITTTFTGPHLHLSGYW